MILVNKKYYIIFTLGNYFVGPLTPAEANHYYKEYSNNGYCVAIVEEVKNNVVEVDVLRAGHTDDG